MKALSINSDTDGVEFWGTKILAKPSHLIQLASKLGAEYYEQNDGTDKSNFDFEFQTEAGDEFLVYDWKQNASLDLNKKYYFNIGARSLGASLRAKSELMIELNKLA